MGQNDVGRCNQPTTQLTFYGYRAARPAHKTRWKFALAKRWIFNAACCKQVHLT